jgi:hypothetical protein
MLIGPAVVAALVSLIGLAFSVQTTRAIHRERLDTDRQLAERRLQADIGLAERKFHLDRAMADWKRRTELAEQVLADFYKAHNLFLSARSPLALTGEGASRKRDEHETESEARHRDAIYAPFERLQKDIDFFSDLHARRYRFKALFGPAAAEPFLAFVSSYNEIAIATRALLRSPGPQDEALRNKFESAIGWTVLEKDHVRQKLDKAVSDMEAICRPVLESVPV